MVRRALLLAFALLLALSPMAAFADFNDAFDSYNTAVVSPGQWVGSSTSSGCLAAQTLSSSSAKTAPNVYEFAEVSSCYLQSNFAKLTLKINSSSSPVKFLFQENLIASSGSIPAGDILTLYENSVSQYSVAVNALAASWTPQTISFFVAPGTSVNMTFTLKTVAAASSYSFTVGLDNIIIHNANVITPSANLFMLDGQTNQWFSIDNYSASFVQVTYPGGTPTIYSSVQIPDIVAATSGASLVTVWVDTSYFVSLIPPSSGNIYFHLFAPATPVFTYTLSVQDLSGVFGPGSSIYISQGGRTFMSGYTDSGDNFQAWLVPGPYSILLTNGASTYSTTQNFPSTSGAAVTLQILQFKGSGNCGSHCTVSYNAGFNPALTSVILEFNDTTRSATSVTDSIYYQSPTGTVQFYTKTWTPGPWGNLQDTIGCATTNCNSTVASNLYATITYTDSFGTSSVSLPLSVSGLFSGTPNVPAALLGFAAAFPAASSSPLAIFSYVILLMTAAVFGAYSAKFGVIVEAFMAGGLVYAGWLPLAPGLVTLFIAIAVSAFISYMEIGK